MLCRLFCKHAKQCKSDLKYEERKMYRDEIKYLAKQIDANEENIVTLTNEVDQYEAELHRVQLLHETDTDIINRLMEENIRLNQIILQMEEAND